MKQVYAIKKLDRECQNYVDWHGIELFESEVDAIAVLTLEARKHIDDEDFTWDGKNLTWTSGDWTHDWWLDMIPIVESGEIVSDLQNIGIKVKRSLKEHYED